LVLHCSGKAVSWYEMILVSRLERDLSEGSLQSYIYLPLALRFTPADQIMPRTGGVGARGCTFSEHVRSELRPSVVLPMLAVRIVTR
jgi:hypothetical protein